MKLCKSCGEINENDSLFCANCGKTDFVFQEEVACSACGANNDKNSLHCTSCGRPLAQKPDVTATPVAVNLRDELADLYGGGVVDASECAVCPNCGEHLPITAMFCQKCGTNVTSLQAHKVVKRKICPHCNQPNSTDAIYCSYCFCSLADGTVTQMQVVHELCNLGEVMVKQAMLDDGSGKKKVCANCGALNDANELFCVNCGLKLEVDPPKKYCPNCSTENQGDSQFCIKCNWSFEGATPKGSGWSCSKCNTENDLESAFCTNCGAKRN